jgi:Ca-activated chloride channel homolog
MDQATYYDRLGLPRDATPDEIRHAYRQLVLRLHPDKNVEKDETSLFIEIQRSYECLADENKRAQYDRGLPRESALASPLMVKTHYSQAALTRLSEPQLIYILLELTIHPDTSLLLSTTPLNICLVVDCSTSMQGIRLDTVKQTAIDLIRQLRPDDIFSLVKFNDFSELLIAPGSLSDLKSTEMKVQLLQAGGGTEIFKGLDMAFSQVSQSRSDERVNHIILITDGRTYGDEALCEQLADQASALGIGISALGIGNQWNDRFLDHVTSKTGGICRYISEIGEIRNTILEEITRLGSSLTEQITYAYQLSPNVELSSAYRLLPDASPLATGSPMIIGAMPRKGSMSILFESTIKDLPSGAVSFPLMKGFLNYEIPRHTLQTKYVQRLSLERQIALAPINEPPPSEIMNAMSYISLLHMQERAREELGKGDVDSAARHLENLATHLLKKGESELAQSVLTEAQYMRRNQTFSEDGEKRIKYGTRSLLLPARTSGK